VPQLRRLAGFPLQPRPDLAATSPAPPVTAPPATTVRADSLAEMPADAGPSPAEPEAAPPEPKAESKRDPEPEPEVARIPAKKPETKKPAPAPVAPPEGWVALRTRPAGNFFLNGSLIAERADSVAVPVVGRFSLEVRHPELYGSRTWSRNAADGDTLDLGIYEVGTGTVRVSTRPHAPIGVLIDGRATRKETPLALTVARGEQLVSMSPPGWTVERVVVTDRTAGTPPREIVPDEPGSFPGVLVDVEEGHDLKVVFHLARAE
jgi:hypothetical protein